MMTELLLPKKSIFGKGAVAQAVEELKKLGEKPLVVTGPHLVKSSMFSDFGDLLLEAGLSYGVFSDLPGEPTVDMIAAGKTAYEENQCDFIIGIGGGSPLDAAKAIAVLVKYPETDFLSLMGKEIAGPFVPIVAVPTTAGTGSEATKFTVITDSLTDTKMLLKSTDLLPDLAIVDYTYTLSSPESVTVATGVDALAHAIESYTSRRHQPFTDVLALSAIEKILTHLPIVYQEPKNEVSREALAYAAYEAGICINNSSVTIVHGMSRPIGALFHVPHGISNAMLLKTCLGFVSEGCYERFGRLGRLAGVAKESDSDELASKNFIDFLEKFVTDIGVPTLKGYGIDETKFLTNISKMSQDAIASGSPGNSIKEVSQSDIESIYHILWEK